MLAARLRTDFDEAVPLGPARLFAVPERVWTELAPDDEWPEPGPERDARGNRKRRWGRRQPICLEPNRGGWPQVVSGEIARQLCRKPGVVSRIVATTEWLDGWWLAELLPGAPIHVRHPECSDPTLAAELGRAARADYERAIKLGWACWT